MIKGLVDAVVNAASGANLDALRSACSALIDRLSQELSAIDPAEARRALNGLRRHRRFVFMRRLAQAFLDDGCRDPEVVRHFAQALIERGETIPAIRILDSLVADTQTPFPEWAEAEVLWVVPGRIVRFGRVESEKTLRRKARVHRSTTTEMHGLRIAI